MNEGQGCGACVPRPAIYFLSMPTHILRPIVISATPIRQLKKLPATAQTFCSQVKLLAFVGMVGMRQPTWQRRYAALMMGSRNCYAFVAQMMTATFIAAYIPLSPKTLKILNTKRQALLP